MKELALPLTGGDNRCIRDARGQVVSIPENAQAFAHAMNMHQKLEDALYCLLGDPGIVSVGAYRTYMPNILIESGKGKLPPAPQEIDAEELTCLMVQTQDQDTQLGDFARVIVKKYKVFPR